MHTLSGGVKIMVCFNCNNAFTFPKPVIPDYSSEDFQARSAETQSLTYVDQLPKEIKFSYNIQLDIIEKKIKKGSSILEIGGGEGIFLDLVKSKGYAVDLIEPSISASNRARKRGLNVHTNYLSEVKSDNRYSLICMSHVLEHMDDPIGTLKQLRPLLQPGGFILLAQSNFQGMMPVLLKKNWYAWLPEQHFTHFSLKGLKFIASKSSMTIVDYRYSRLVHSNTLYHRILKYIPFLQDQIHILFQAQSTEKSTQFTTKKNKLLN
ncbi:MAG: class I SAM-dependent methyltransferase [Cyclobacteriaceae bacterium]|nr:class I SAM-dependent methyltransferase [Cyclobacteriaceae bacterium]MDH5248133.1 class I SAM-dependent methyltransferase [Cyclobacteriaceae bacterium]